VQQQKQIDDMPPEFGDNVDNEVFGQILEMDESQEEREFSAPLVFGFFEQASTTFQEMKKAL
jgi:osomolarity two-component system phosphorelay intermediate protein YPD1